MNAKVIFGVMTFVAGAATGSLVTYFFSKKYFDEKRDEEVYNIRKWAQQKVVDEDENRRVEIAEAYAKNNDISTLTPEGREALIKKYAGYLEELTGNKVMTPEEYDEALANGDFDEDEIPFDESPSEEVLTPYEIEKGEFMVDDSHEKVSLFFYMGDEVWTDNENDPVNLTDIERFVGPVDEIKFNSEKTEVYIRNDYLMADYEILCFEDSYKNAQDGSADDED